MKNFILLLSIYYILFLQCSYTRTVSIESTNIPDELISRFDNTTSWVKNESNYKICRSDLSAYCKDNVCVCVEPSNIKPFIEFPDKNGYIHKYIMIPYVYNYEEKISDYIESNNNKIIDVSTDCKTDTQCFSNKCFNNTCTYNVNANVESCDTIYTETTLFSESNSDIYCGLMVGESCTKDIDCSFKACYNGTCHKIQYIPTDYRLTRAFVNLGIIAGIIFILIIICCCCCFVKCYKKNNNTNVKK